MTNYARHQVPHRKCHAYSITVHEIAQSAIISESAVNGDCDEMFENLFPNSFLANREGFTHELL